MITIGISGLIGAGKSTICSYLVDMGAELIDADLVGHSIYTNDLESCGEIVSLFGDEILDQENQINRQKLSDIVFNNFDSLKKLNSIVHPRMKKIIGDKINCYKSNGFKVVVLEAAILLQSGWRDLVDEVWTVTSLKDIVLSRIINRDQMNLKRYESILQSQNSYLFDVFNQDINPDVIIENNDSMEILRREVVSLWETRILKSR